MTTDELRALIRDIPDFPRPGIVFKDISPLLGDAEAFRAAIDAMAADFRDAGIRRVVAVESRGFVVGGALAYVLGAGFVPVRKQGKLPHSTQAIAYSLEYGEGILEIHEDAIERGDRVLVVDDLLATGGTAVATVQLVERLGGEVVGIAFLVELSFLEGAKNLAGRPYQSLIKY